MPSSNSPFFSIVIPWHRNEDLLRRAMASLEKLAGGDHEIIVVCNGQSAGEARRIAALPSSSPLRAIDSQPGDANAARNAGIDAAAGQWIAFLDCDDEFLPDKLQHVRQALQSSPADIILSRGIRLRGRGEESAFPKTLFDPAWNIAEYFFTSGNNCSTSAIVAKVDSARKVRFAPGLEKFQDNDFLIRAQASGAVIQMLAEPLFRWHDATSEGRISRGVNYDRQIAWAKSLYPALTDAAFHAFCSRRVAQYVFPRDFWVNARRFWNGWRKGKISAIETLMFVVRALLPEKLAWWAVGMHSRIGGPRRTAQIPGHNEAGDANRAA
jgi:glycosyltransferase involved in cell wall biosynthesis